MSSLGRQSAEGRGDGGQSGGKGEQIEYFLCSFHAVVPSVSNN